MFQITVPIDSGEPVFEDPDVERDYMRVTGAAFAKDGHKHLPTPDKDKIMALSCSYDRKRLGKQQPLLQNIAHRCREQEVTDLSGSCVKKCKLEKQGKREISSYGTNSMKSRNTSSTSTLDGRMGGSNMSDSYETSVRPMLERNYTFFPHRRVLKSPDKQYGTPPNGIYFPRVSAGLFKNSTPTKKIPMVFGPDKRFQKVPARLACKQTALASTTTSLPCIKFADNEKDRVDSYIQARGFQQGSKPNSNLADYQFRSRAVNYQWASKYASKSVV